MVLGQIIFGKAFNFLVLSYVIGKLSITSRNELSFAVHSASVLYMTKNCRNAERET